MSDKELIKQEVERLKGKVDDDSSYSNGWKQSLRMIEIFIDSLPEEPASEDLKKAAYNHCVEQKTYSFYDSFMAGAEWQKQQMMKDAVELRIVEYFNPVGTENEKPHGFTALCYNAKYPDFYPITGQTVKVIPIKEE